MKRLPDIITLGIITANGLGFPGRITANGLGVSWSALWSWWVHRDPSAFWLRENALIPYQHSSVRRFFSAVWNDVNNISQATKEHVPIGILDRRLYSTQDSIDK